jgi:putative transposase
MLISLTTLLTNLSSIFYSRAALQLENLALRHQIGVLQRSVRNRPRLTLVDRLLWVWLSRIWSGWRSALAIVRPETVVAWHRKGFRLFWTWKVRHGQPGRPVISRELRDLIRKMCRENPSWGAPRIHGELLKLGIDIGESSVSKYMVRNRKPPSQTGCLKSQSLPGCELPPLGVLKSVSGLCSLAHACIGEFHSLDSDRAAIC